MEYDLHRCFLTSWNSSTANNSLNADWKHGLSIKLQCILHGVTTSIIIEVNSELVSLVFDRSFCVSKGIFKQCNLAVLIDQLELLRYLEDNGKNSYGN